MMMFYFILFSNVLGLLPYGFTLTSQLYVTFLCSISTFIGITIIGMWVNKFNFISFFIPGSVTNIPLRSFLVLIEILSYMIRPLSLGIRLFANMLAGHTLIFIMANFTYLIAFRFIFLTLIIPFIIIFLVMILEFCIAFIQTYVFIILTIIYIKDMMAMYH
jgi:ATP synthase subunit 6